jgi:hypothetical protein
MYTEDEAKKKWCPDSRVASKNGPSYGGNHAYNRTAHPDDNPSGQCIASECMKWRWVVDTQGNIKLKRTKLDETHAECNGKGCDNCDYHGHTGEFSQLGYCGAGGTP